MTINLNQKGSETRSKFESTTEFTFTQAPQPSWQPGQGAIDSTWSQHEKITFSVSDTTADNYRLLISGITPRPIGFIGTVGKDGVKNIAPFSFFNVNLSNPPIFSIGVSGEKDTKKNILETGECTINIISEWFIELANFTSLDCPLDKDEFEISGLHPLESIKVKLPHVLELLFSIEAKLRYHHQFYSLLNPDEKSGMVFIVEGVQFHVREDLFDKDRHIIDIKKFKPVSRIGGVGYLRTTSGYELLRPVYDDVKGKLL